MDNSEKRQVLVVEKSGSIYFLINSFIGSYNRRTDLWEKQGNSELLKAINNLTKKVEDFMATQEERLQAIAAKLTAVQAGVDKIQQQLADLKASNPDLEDEIAAIEATAAGLDTDVNPPAPEPEPTPDDVPPVV